MLRFNALVFDDVIQGTTSVYTDPAWNEKMANPDTFIFGYTASQSSASSTLTIESEISGDGVNWLNGATLVNAVALSSTDKTSAGITPQSSALRYLRLKITLGGTNPQTRLQIWFAGRDFAL